MRTRAIVFERPQELSVRELALTPPRDDDVVVDIEWTGISSGTERLLWSGRMPDFPGMGYPLVPGYESVGRITQAGTNSGRTTGERVFVPGARCFNDARGLFGGAAARLVVPGARTFPLGDTICEQGVLVALAATAYHALGTVTDGPMLIVGHGALGRLLARLVTIADAPPPTVWETNADRRTKTSYPVIHPAADATHAYRTIYDVSGDGQLLDDLIARLAPGGEIVLAGFYAQPLSFLFPPAFLREARLRVAAEWKPADITAVLGLANTGALDLNGLITHREVADRAADAYATAFTDPTCVKMVLDWRQEA